MKTRSELSDFYFKELYPTLEKLEKQRERVKQHFFQTTFAISGGGVFLAFILNSLTHDSSITLFILFATLVLIAIAYKKIIKGYVGEFKRLIITPLIKAIDPNLSYQANRFIQKEEFMASRIFPYRKIDRLSGNDLVEGVVDDVFIRFSDITAEVKEHTSRNSESEYRPVFMGQFFVSSFPKKFHASTIIHPDIAQKVLGDYVGGVMQGFNTRQEQLVKMDSPEFEKEFVVYSSDQIEARYILTPSLMEKILRLKKQAKHPLYISFVENKIFIAIAYGKDLFEPSVFHSLLKYNIAMEYISSLHLTLSIVKELNLNFRI